MKNLLKEILEELQEIKELLKIIKNNQEQKDEVSIQIEGNTLSEYIVSMANSINSSPHRKYIK